MIETPYRFEANLTDQEFKKIGQFAFRWLHMDHTVGNCLRRLLRLDPKQATVIIFPLSLNDRMSRIEQLAKLQPLSSPSQLLLGELKPLIRAMQFLRNSTLHGIVIDVGGHEEPYFHLRLRLQPLKKRSCSGAKI